MKPTQPSLSKLFLVLGVLGLLGSQANAQPPRFTLPAQSTVVEAALNGLKYRYDPYMQTLQARLDQGRYAEALSLCRTLIQIGEDKSLLQKTLAESGPSVIEEIDGWLQAHASEAKSVFDVGGERKRWIELQLDKLVSYIKGLSGFGHGYAIHILFLEGKYAQAIAEGERLLAEAKSYHWEYTYGGEQYQTPAQIHTWPKDAICSGTIQVGNNSVYGIDLDLAICYYQQREYVQARDYFLQSWLVRNSLPFTFGYYAQRLREHFREIGYQELGGILYLAETLNAEGEEAASGGWFISAPPDSRYCGDLKAALRYAEEAYKLMPNNLDACQQYCVLLYALKHYMQVIDVYEYMYSLIKKGPSAYVTAQTNFSLNNINVAVPKSCWEAWKRKHPGQKTFYLPYWEDK
jgi:tetratricopeptide (TPR) repeat protein